MTFLKNGASGGAGSKGEKGDNGSSGNKGPNGRPGIMGDKGKPLTEEQVIKIVNGNTDELLICIYIYFLQKNFFIF